MKKLIIFDLDGTLAKSKTAIDSEMAHLFKELLEVVQVSIISGGDWPQFETQVLAHLPQESSLKNLTILPTCGTKFFQYKSEWIRLYEERFTNEEKDKILKELIGTLELVDFEIPQTWGEQIEDRGSQITFSALGQKAPLEEKKKWDPNFKKRTKVVELLTPLLPEFSIGMGGTTSIDIVKPGIDKAYGIHKLKDVLKLEVSEILFIGDALFEGGNDYPARKTGVSCIQVRDPEETKRVIETIISMLN